MLDTGLGPVVLLPSTLLNLFRFLGSSVFEVIDDNEEEDDEEEDDDDEEEEDDEETERKALTKKRSEVRLWMRWTCSS